MLTRTRRMIGRGGVALVLVLVLVNLLLQGSARADGLVTAGQLFRINRLTIGLLVRGQDIAAILDFDILLEGCAANVPGACNGVYSAAKAVGLSTDPNLVLSIGVAESPIGTWSIFETFGGASGSLDIVRGTSTAAYVGNATFTGGGKVTIGFYDGFLGTDGLDRYDFTYNNSNGDRGVGFVKWTPSGCALVGPFTSQVFKGPNGVFNTGIVVMARC